MRGNRRRKQRSTTTLIVTFLLGIGIGYSLHYAQVQISGPPPGDAAQQTLPPTPGAPEASAQATPDSSADVENLWPARHLFIGIEGTTLDEGTRALISEYKPGGIVLREQNLVDATQTRSLVREIKEAAGQGLGVTALPLIAISQEGGAVNPLQIEGLRNASDIGGDERAARQAAREIGTAARARDIAVVFAPVLEVAPTALDGTERLRFFSSDPATVAEVGIAFANGLLDGGALPVVKRYPGYGTGAGAVGVTTLEERNTDELARLMYPFSEAAEAELPGLLVGHVMVPAVDTVSPASLSSGLVNKIIRDSWEYTGVVIADDVTAAATIADRKPEEAAAEALIAGCDAVLVLQVDRALMEHISAGVLDVVKAGLLGKETLQASKARLDAWRDRIETLPVHVEPPAPEGIPLVIEPPAPEEVPGATEPVPDAAAAAPTVESETPPAVEAPAVPVDAPAEATPDAPATETPEEAAPVETAAEETPAVEPEPEAAAEPAPAEAPAEAPAPAPEPAASEEPNQGRRAAMQPPNTRRLRHRIEKGDTLTSIATKYGTSVDKLRAWNSLEDNEIKWGYTLTVFVPEDQKTPAAEAPAPPVPTPEVPVAVVSEEAPATQDNEPAPPPITPANDAVEPAPVDPPLPAPAAADVPTTIREHRLGKEETLDQVATNFGVTKEQIMEWNKLLVDTPEPGYLLKIHLPVAIEE